MQSAAKSIPFVIPAQALESASPQLPKHFFQALNSGWTVVRDSLELQCYHGRWSGKMLLSSGTTTARLVVSFTASDGGYRFTAPELLK